MAVLQQRLALVVLEWGVGLMFTTGPVFYRANSLRLFSTVAIFGRGEKRNQWGFGGMCKGGKRFYTGRVEFEGTFIRAQHDAIVSDVLFEKCNSLGCNRELKTLK